MQNHPSAQVRSATLSVFVNLNAASPSRRRPAKEIRERLKVCGLKERLQLMETDASLDVRERVRDALLVF